MFEISSVVIDALQTIPATVVRSSYDTEKPTYPLITVMQMDNHELKKYTTIDTVERGSAIPFQIDCYARAMEIDGKIVSAAEAAEYFRVEVDKIMQEMLGMRRSAAPPIIPHKTDKTVMRAISRYDCMVDIDYGIIYKK